MKNMILDLELQILDQIINEGGKDPIDAAIKEKVAEWKILKRKLAVISKMAKTIGDRVSELETNFEEVVKQIDGNKTVVDGAIIELGKKKGNTTVKYKEVVDYTLKMVNEAQKQVIEKFIESVTTQGQFKDVLAVQDPELEAFLLSMKPIDGDEMVDKIESMARSGFEKLPKLVANAKKRELKEGVIANVAKVIKNLAQTFKSKFKKLFKAVDKSGEAANAFAAAVKADPLKESYEGYEFLNEDQNFTDYGQWQSACKQNRQGVWFDGDQKECSAYEGEQPFTQGQTTLVGSWNGKSGTAQAPAQQNEAVEVGYYVEDSKNKKVAGPFKTSEEAQKECDKRGGDEKGFTIGYVSDYSARRQNESLVTEAASAWERLETLKKEFRALGDEIDSRVKGGEEVTLEDKIIKKMLKLRNKLGTLNKKLGIPRPGDIKQ